MPELNLKPLPCPFCGSTKLKVDQKTSSNTKWNSETGRCDKLVVVNVIKTFIDMGFNRYRISVIDMYPHVRERFKAVGLPLPYGLKFSPNESQLRAVDGMILDAKNHLISLGKPLKDLRIESCAEPGLTEAIACGCISGYDLELLKLYYGSPPDKVGYQRKNCMCYSGKVELLEHKQQCPHSCLYCYWKSK